VKLCSLPSDPLTMRRSSARCQHAAKGNTSLGNLNLYRLLRPRLSVVRVDGVPAVRATLLWGSTIDHRIVPALFLCGSSCCVNLSLDRFLFLGTLDLAQGIYSLGSCLLQPSGCLPHRFPSSGVFDGQKLEYY
jgi:hypothetical protein